jgi:hypothetical protein
MQAALASLHAVHLLSPWSSSSSWLQMVRANKGSTEGSLQLSMVA